ncbi:MAG: alpha/beta hydrolase [Lactobacillus sp.]
MSKIVFSTFFSRTLGIDWNYDIYLPDNYNPGKKYSFLLMLHGIYGNHTNLLERLDSKKIIDTFSNENTQVIALFIDGFNSFYIDSIHGMKMEQAIISELLPYIFSKYSIDPSPAKHGIGGISMGGYGAARLALKYSNIFQHAYLLSPAVWSADSIYPPIFKTIHTFSSKDHNWDLSLYNSLFPTAYLDKANKHVTFFIKTSTKDQVVPFNSVDTFVNQLNKNNNPVTFVPDNFGGHNWGYWNQAINALYKNALLDLNK